MLLILNVPFLHVKLLMAYRLGSALMDPVLTVLYVTTHQSALGTLSEYLNEHTDNSSDVFREFKNVQRVVEISATDRGPFNLTIRNGHAPNLVSASRQKVRCVDSMLAYNNDVTRECRSISNHRQLDSFLRLRTEKTSKLLITDPLWGRSIRCPRFLSQRASNAESVSISYCHHTKLNPGVDIVWTCAVCWCLQWPHFMRKWAAIRYRYNDDGWYVLCQYSITPAYY